MKISLAAITTALSLTLMILACSPEPQEENQLIWYTYPAQFWNSQSLHLGNGYMGASFFGGVEREKFSITEESMWCGGPFRGNWQEAGVNPRARESLDRIRKAVAEGNIRLADSLSNRNYLGGMGRFGHFTSIGDLFLEMDQHEQPCTAYSRSLDLAHSIGSVSYEMNGVRYEREYFCSYPHNVLVMRIRSDVPGSVGFTLGMDILQRDYKVEVSENRYIVSGTVNDGDDRRFRAEVVAISYGTSTVQGESSLEIHQADSVVLILSAATDYKQEFPEYRGDDPAIKCAGLLEVAQNLGYAALKRAHIGDYTSLYDRVKLSLNSDPELNALPTNERWERMKQGHIDTGLKELAFNLGRYLIISSSRPGTLPANLQGKWNTMLNPPWTGNYQANINIQEIYWPCGPVNLIECQEPYVEWTKDLVKSGRETARQVYGTHGWISHTIGNIWGHTAPVGGIPWGVYPLAPVWHCQHLWEQFNFTMDTSYLEQTAYPIMKEAAVFWMENLVEYRGYLIAAPSISAEHGAFFPEEKAVLFNIPGASQDAQMIGDLFKNCIRAAEILDLDLSFRDSVRQFHARLIPPKIGKYGQLQEWFEDLDSPDDHHRHISHLYAVCPGSGIHPVTTPRLAEAAMISLNMRGEGRFMEYDPASGGNWSLAWRIWCWARLMDGDRANKIFTGMLTEEGFENLTTFQHASYGEGGEDLAVDQDSLHLHFQLDGSATTPGFMAEMLLQSHLGEILLLPALPGEWRTGNVTGLKARGGYTVDINWKKGKLEKATISGGSGTIPRIRVVDKVVDPSTDRRIQYVSNPL
ncbi:MAG: glycoside hydrolase family 95 protein [Bacteroidota bacterium]